MKILLAPSEGKLQGGKSELLKVDTLLFSELSAQRQSILEKYNHYIHNCSDEDLCKLFGIKDIIKAKTFLNDLFNSPTQKAIVRYSGVAFEYLQYSNLPIYVQKYINNSTIIFSNLFGPILASDTIPEYKLKQGEKLEGIALELFYKKEFTSALDSYLQDEDILDLRAGFYDKFYKPSKPYTTLKFIKNGKVVSHWAKAYRGIVLREIAKSNITTIKEFKNFSIEGLQFIEEKTTKLKTERIYNIL